MSSDLWKEFVDSAGNLSENPWAQTFPSGDSTIQRSQKADIKAAIITPMFNYAEKWNSQVDHEVQWGKSGLVSHVKGIPTVETGSGVEATNVWATTPPHRQEIDSRPITESESGLGAASTQMSGYESAASFEEFGTFVGPEDSSYTTEKDEKLNHPNIFTETQSLKNVFSSSRETDRYQASKTPSCHESNPYMGLEILENSANCKVRSPSTPRTNVQAKELPDKRVRATSPKESVLVIPYRADEWGDFSPDPQDSKMAPTKFSRRSPTSPDARNGLNSGPSKPRAKPLGYKRPFNVPPPSVLVSHFTSLIQNLPNHVEAVVRRSSNKEISQGDLEKALHSCIASLRIAARIITGRKLRWKRDNVLSTSMTIGLAQAGGKSGMKLTGIDRTEGRREDGEVAECVRVWKQYLGKIRGALATATGQTSGSPLVLPEISETVTITATKLAGPKTPLSGCALCGLVREERAAKVDVDVWDNLGEWWSDGWGHTECREFWEEHQKFVQPT